MDAKSIIERSRALGLSVASSIDRAQLICALKQARVPFATDQRDMLTKFED
jgi:hypothetical protein